LGTGGTSGAFNGAFDNQYMNSSQTSPTGAFYVCAGSPPTLYRIPITGNSMGTATNLQITATGTVANCSPLTEFFNNSSAATTLSAAATSSATTLSVASGTGFANSDFIQIDSEIMQITTGGGGTSLTVTRGQSGTTAAAHSSGAAVANVHDWLFVSVASGGNKTGCTGACLYSFNVTGGALPADATAGLVSASGTSGIIVDNAVGAGSLPGASQVYFTPLGAQTCVGNGTTGNLASSGCAIQASQAGLQ
jgi:hypothetical protein